METDKNQNIYPIAIVYDDSNRKGVVLKIECFNKTGTCVDISQHFKIVVIENTEKIHLQYAFQKEIGKYYQSDNNEIWHLEKEI